MTRARLIMVAWGEAYLDHLLRFAVPSVLAPGNLPALAEEFACEFVLVTEAHLFERVKNDPSYPQLCRYCSVILKPVDDLISPWYGISLTYAYVRGYADLGEELTESYLLFLNSDFIMADGCYRSLLPYMRGEPTAIFAPSYCSVAEEVAPQLEARIDPDSRTLSLLPREMARMVLDHRHNTVRGKTINDGDFHMHWIDQFYWGVDEQTLLSRQLPIAIVCLKPTQALIDPTAFWDYGIVYDICPGVEPTVLGDSDQFVMLELRDRAVGEDQIESGWPGTAVIADRLSQFTADYMRDFGLYDLILHAGPLPKSLPGAQQALKHYVEEVYAQMTPAMSYRNHKFWEYHWPLFHQYRVEVRIRLQLFDRPTLSGIVARGDQVGLRMLGDPLPTVHGRTADDETYHRRFGLLPWPTPNHPYRAEFLNVMTRSGMSSTENANRILIANQNPVIVPHLNSRPGNTVTAPPAIVRSHGFHPAHFETFQPTATDAPEPLPAAGRQSFDFCFCELTFPQLLSFRKTYENVRTAMKPGSRIIAYHACFRARPIPRRHIEHLVRHFPQDRDKISFYFTGYSRFAPRLALRLFHYGLSFRPPNSAHGDRRLLLAMRLGMPFARLRAFCAWLRRLFFTPHRVPAHCTSIVIEIEVVGDQSVEPVAAANGKMD